jgi:hypothetical protein
MKRLVLFVAAIGLLGGALQAAAITPAEVKVKKAIADTMTASELAAYKQRLADRVNQGLINRSKGNRLRTPADTCTAATPEIGPLPYTPAADTTVGQADNFDLPADTTNPTCAVGASCTGAGPAGSLPFGAIYTGTGTGPDRAYRIITNANCTLTISMDPTSSQDLALILYQANCSSSLADCACVSDTGIGGAVETVTLNAVAGTTYFVVVDGYSTGATPPGPSGPFTISVTGTGCALTPVGLQTFSVDGK